MRGQRRQRGGPSGGRKLETNSDHLTDSCQTRKDGDWSDASSFATGLCPPLLHLKWRRVNCLHTGPEPYQFELLAQTVVPTTPDAKANKAVQERMGPVITH